MDLQVLSNFFTLTAEILIGILAVQGIATTFIFSKKGEWTYVDKWEFFWVIFNNVTGTIVCVFSIFLLITSHSSSLVEALSEIESRSPIT